MTEMFLALQREEPSKQLYRVSHAKSHTTHTQNTWLPGKQIQSHKTANMETNFYTDLLLNKRAALKKCYWYDDIYVYVYKIIYYNILKYNIYYFCIYWTHF